jgi:hypothetical protein
MSFTRRELALLAATPRAQERGGLCLNEDPNHYFASRAGQRLSAAQVESWVDQYAKTQVRELILCINSMRTAYPSKVWEPYWADYDPQGGEAQPLIAALPAAARPRALGWIHQAWQLHHDGIDHLALWQRRARQHRLPVWLSSRMNDLHDVDNEQHPLHSSFWKEHPELRRVSWRLEQRDKALNFLLPAVRERHLALLREAWLRYPCDGLELDWMRHGFHFPPGQEEVGRRVTTEFQRVVRRLIGPRAKLAVRVPGHPQTAWRLGYDVLQWAREGLVDHVTVTNYWRTTDSTMPIGLWRSLLPARVTLGAGLELGLNAYELSRAADGGAWQPNNLETVRGSAAAFLEAGADRIYLFNYMDSDTTIRSEAEYRRLLKECGYLSTLRDLSRRHVSTYNDNWAPGERKHWPLPVEMTANRWATWRLPTGTAARGGELRLGLHGESVAAAQWEVRLDGQLCHFVGPVAGLQPGPDCPVYRWRLPDEAQPAGDSVIDARAAAQAQVRWVELYYPGA